MTQAARRKFHYIYKITRTDGSGKFYVGMHSTDNLEDGYFGSGQVLWKSIRKHGKEKHSKEILEFLPSREALKLREREMVNEDLLGDKLCMNLKLGGEGGWTEQARLAGASKGNAAQMAKLEDKNSAWFRSRSAKISAAHTGQPQRGGTRGKNFTKISGSCDGQKNSQFGTCWVTNGIPVKIKIDLLEDYLSRGFQRGRASK